MNKSSRIISPHTNQYISVGTPDAVYQEGLKDGFSVESAKEYIQAGQPGHEEQLALAVKTPYSYNNKPVQGYSVIDLKSDISEDPTMSVRGFHTCELYASGVNVEDIHDNTADSRSALYLDSPDGKIPYEDALDRIGVFSQAASFHEHVMEYDEYKSVFDHTHEQLIREKYIEPASEPKYEKYLNSVKNLMNDGMEYIGVVTKPDDVGKMRETMPSYQPENTSAVDIPHVSTDNSTIETRDLPDIAADRDATPCLSGIGE